MTKLEIIEETAKSYTTANRAMDSNGACHYIQPESNNKCAVGRCMNELGLEFWGKFNGTVADLVDEMSSPLDSYLKEEYRGHGEQFWRDVQKFHDNSDNWDSKGLSQDGEETKAVLIKRWS